VAGTADDRFSAVADGLREAARRFGTPAYVTDLATIERAGAALRSAFPDPWLRHYSIKANDVVAIVAAAAAAAAGATVVSRGEWAIARRAGLADADIALEGIGKTDLDLRAAVRATADGHPLRWLAVESGDEISRLIELARRSDLGRRGRPPIEILLRVNPDVAPETHAGLAVGAGGSKFGMTEAEVAAGLDLIEASGGAVLARGVHLHVGSQLGAVDAWREAVRHALAVFALLQGNAPTMDTLDLGGGFPVAAVGEPSPGPDRFARELPALLDAIPAERRPRRLAIEPGRFLVARAGWLIATVLHVRDRGGRQVVIDAGMTELIRPALYGARHDIVALTSLGSVAAGDSPAMGDTNDVATVHGPICESTDALGDHRLPPLRRGDLVAIRDTGAYGASLSSTYNGRPRPPQILLATDGTVTLARRRGSVSSLG
jgi:diaminopimelate decarboxylase